MFSSLDHAAPSSIVTAGNAASVEVPQRRRRPHPLDPAPHRGDVLVMTGADAQRSRSARETASAVSHALDRAGYAVTIVDARGAARFVADRDVLVVPCVHDSRIAEGVLQDHLELLGTSYVGSDGAAARLCADKAATKAVLALAGVLVPRSCVVSNGAIVALDIRSTLPFLGQLGDGVVIKPLRGAGGAGVRVTTSADEAASAVIAALSYDHSLLVERLVEGIEVSALVLGDAERAEVLGTAAVSNPRLRDPLSHEWSRRFVPVTDADVRTTAAAAARLAFRALGLHGYGTVDMVVDASGAWVFDVDCDLDVSADSRFVACATAGGFSTDAVICSIVDAAAAAQTDAEEGPCSAA